MLRLALLTAVIAALLGALLWFGLRSDVELVEEVLPARGEAAESVEAGMEELAIPDADRRFGPVDAPAGEALANEDERKEVAHTPTDLFVGVVVDTSGRALPGVRVVRGIPGDVQRFRKNERPAHDRGVDPANLPRFTTHTDEGGRFTYALPDGLGDELLIWQLALEGYLPEQRHSVLERGQLGTLRMARKEEAQLSIRVIDATTGQPVPTFHFEIKFESSGTIWSHLSRTEKGSDGEARFPLFFPRGCDSVEVTSWAEGMVPEDRDDPAGLHRARFRPVAGEAHNIRLILILDRPEREADAVVSGTVYSLASGEVLPGAEVHHLDREVQTGSDGRFRIATIRGGALWAAAEDHDHVRAEVQPEQELELRLPGIAVLFGRVVDGSGDGIPDIDLKIQEGDQRSPTRSRRRLRMTTDEEGGFSIELRSGTYAMTWDPDLPGEGDRIVLVELAPGERHELILERESQAFAILEGEVRVEGVGEMWPAFVELDGDGSVSLGEQGDGDQYRTAPLPMGRYAVILVNERGPEAGILLPPIEVSRPGRQTFDFRPSIGRLRGRVEGALEGKTYAVFVPRGAGGKRMETLFGGLKLAKEVGDKLEKDGRFELPAVLLRDGELQLYDEQGLRARRATDPRRESDIGVWYVR